MPREDTQFKPGQSGNPKGRPPGSKSLTTLLKEQKDRLACTVPALRDPSPIYKGGYQVGIRPSIIEYCGLDLETATVGEVLACYEFIHSIDGNSGFAAQIHDRTEGKVKQDLGIENKGPLVVVLDESKGADDETS